MLHNDALSYMFTQAAGWRGRRLSIIIPQFTLTKMSSFVDDADVDAFLLEFWRLKREKKQPWTPLRMARGEERNGYPIFLPGLSKGESGQSAHTTQAKTSNMASTLESKVEERKDNNEKTVDREKVWLGRGREDGHESEFSCFMFSFLTPWPPHPWNQFWFR